MDDLIRKMCTNNNMQSVQSAIYTATTVAVRVVNNNRRRRENSSRRGDTSEDNEKSGTDVESADIN